MICVNERLAASDALWKECLAPLPVTELPFCCKYNNSDSGNVDPFAGAIVPLKETL